MDAQSKDNIGKPHIVVAIGNAAQQSSVVAALAGFYNVDMFPDTPRALAACRVRPPLVAVVGENLPPSNGYDLVHMLRLDPALAGIPVMMVVSKNNSLTRNAVNKCRAQSYVTESCPDTVLVSAVSNLVNSRIERQWQTLPALQRQALTGTLGLFTGLSNAISNGEPIVFEAIGDACKPLVDAVGNNDFKGILRGVRNHDDYTYAHSMRVATLLALFGSNLGLSKDEQVILASGGLLHDVGKMSIPNAVLNKAGRLTPAEFDVMKGHVNASITYLERCSDLPRGILTIAAQHHEKLDGTGYPGNLMGNKLDRLARMASIIDVFSALTDRRVYKPAMDPEAALKIMTDEMASHLDMTLLGLFRQMLLDAARDSV